VYREAGDVVGSNVPDLSWLADAPVFIDNQQVSAFYDAVVGPAFRTVQLQISSGHNEQLEKSAGVSASPRMLAFIDVPPGTILLPQAAGLNDGRVVTFFDPLIEKLQLDGGAPPVPYSATTATAEGKRQRDDHWKWYADHWNLDKAVQATEETIGNGGRPRWIDYRMTFAAGEVLHLHVAAHGDYDIGVFAYNLIRRGERYGLRIVGSLKSQPSLNVLAIYEK
jgi:hypothetical protein